LGEAFADNHFTIRTKAQIEKKNEGNQFKSYWWKVVFNRINGELCAFNTIRIIESYKPKIWIIENQLGRRNLNAAQRIELALCKADVLREQAKENLSKGGGDRKSPSPKVDSPTDPIDFQKAIAKEADVGNGTMQRYMQVKESGNPALLEQVQSGELKIGTAHRMLMPEIKKQMREADKMLAYIQERLPLDDEKSNRVIHERLKQLAEQIRGYAWMQD